MYETRKYKQTRYLKIVNMPYKDSILKFHCIKMRPLYCLSLGTEITEVSFTFISMMLKYNINYRLKIIKILLQVSNIFQTVCITGQPARRKLLMPQDKTAILMQ